MGWVVRVHRTSFGPSPASGCSPPIHSAKAAGSRSSRAMETFGKPSAQAEAAKKRAANDQRRVEMLKLGLLEKRTRLSDAIWLVSSVNKNLIFLCCMR